MVGVAVTLIVEAVIGSVMLLIVMKTSSQPDPNDQDHD